MQRDIGLDALDCHFGERDAHPPDRLVAVLPVRDDFADQRVVVGRHRVALVNMRIDPDTGSPWRVIRRNAPGRWRETEWVLGIDAALYRVAAKLDVLLSHGEALARRDADLLLDDVDPSDHFGHRVLDLDACVHFDEVELTFLVEILESASPSIADLAAGLDAALADARALLRRKLGCRGLLHDLLVPSLHGAIALAEIDRVPVPVGEHLHLDVSRVLEVLFEIDGGVAEGRPGFRPCDAYCTLERGFGVHDTHASASAPTRCLYDDRITDLSRDLERFLRAIGQRTIRAGDARHSGFLHDLLCVYFVAHQPDGLRLRTDENEATLVHAFGKVRVFGEKSVAGMNCLGVGHLRGTDDGRYVEIARTGCRRSDAHRFVGELHVLGLAVGLGMNYHGLDAHVTARALDAQGDLSAIGNQNFLEHDLMGGLSTSDMGNSRRARVSPLFDTHSASRSSSRIRRIRPADRSRP